MLQEFASNLWVADQTLRFLGVEVGSRMSVIRLGSGELFVHSPIRPVSGLYDEVAALGTVRWLVAPNCMHHLSIGDWAKQFPDAEVLIAPGLEKKRADLADEAQLSVDRAAAWKPEIEAAFLEGLPMFNEFVFFHEPTRTLVITDIAFNFGDESPWLTRQFIRMTGQLGALAPTLVEKLMIRDRKAYRASLDRVLEWPFERVVVSHGTNLEKGGRRALARGYAWLEA